MFPPLPKDRKAIVSALLRKPLLEKNDEKALRLLCLQSAHKAQQNARLSSETPSLSYHRPCDTITRSGFQSSI